MYTCANVLFDCASEVISPWNWRTDGRTPDHGNVSGTLLDPNWFEVWKRERALWFYEEEWQVYLMAVEPGK
jgi:hypothetical protein